MNRGFFHENWYHWCYGPSWFENFRRSKNRGHEVTAIVRNAGKITQTHKDINILQKDIFDLTLSDLSDQNVVVDAYGISPDEAENMSLPLIT